MKIQMTLCLLFLSQQHAMHRTHLNTKTQTKRFERAQRTTDSRETSTRKRNGLHAQEFRIFEEQTCDDCLLQTLLCTCSGYACFQSYALMRARQMHQPIVDIANTLTFTECLTEMTCLAYLWRKRRNVERTEQRDIIKKALAQVDEDIRSLHMTNKRR